MKPSDRVIQSKLKDHEVDVPDGLWEEIERRLPSKRKVPVWKKYVRYAAAASLLLACGLSGYLLLQPHTSGTRWVQQTIEEASLATESLSPTLTETQAQSPDNQNQGQPAMAERASIGTGSKPAATRPDMVAQEIGQEQQLPAQVHGSDAVTTSQETLQGQPSEENHRHDNKAGREIRGEGTSVDNSGTEPSHRAKETTPGHTTTAQYAHASPTGRKRSDRPNDPGYSLGIVSANAISATQYAQDTRITRSNLYYANESQILKYQHKVPISVGITVEKQFGKRWGLESGLVYTLLRSDYKTENLQREGKQELHYLGIPLMVRFKFFNTRFIGLYAAAGPRMDFNIYGRRTDDTYTQLAYSTYTENIRDRRVQWSAHLKVGVSYIISRHFDIYAEPALAYFFDNGNKSIENLWKDKPLNFAFHLGIRTKF